MKIAAIAAAATLVATTVSAAELGNTGISIGAELDNNYNVDKEEFTMTLSPELGYSAYGADFEVSTDLTLYNGDEFSFNEDELPTVDFGIEYGMDVWALDATVYAETGYDLEAEDMSDVEVGVTFKF